MEKASSFQTLRTKNQQYIPKTSTEFLRLIKDANNTGKSATVSDRDINNSKILSFPGVVHQPREAVSREPQDVVDFVLRIFKDNLRERFLFDVAYAAAEAVTKNSLWPIAEVLQGWEADAEISDQPTWANEVDEALSEYKAGDKGRPWEEIIQELDINGESEE